MNSALLRELDRLRSAGDPASARAEIVRMFEAVRAAAYEDAARVCYAERLSMETNSAEDEAYNTAIHHVVHAIRKRAKEVGE